MYCDDPENVDSSWNDSKSVHEVLHKGSTTQSEDKGAFLSALINSDSESKELAQAVSQNVAKEAVRRCEEVVSGMRAAASNRGNGEDPMAPFQLKELVLGELLGEGEFSCVHEINSFRPSSDREYGLDEDDARTFLAKHARREETGDARYAIKYLRPALLKKSKKFLVGAQDLALEALLLSSISHPHIVKLRGLAESGTAGFANGLNTGYFLIMDRLNDTLQCRLRQWRKEQKKHDRGIMNKIWDRKGKKQKRFLQDRLKVGFDIAGALEHLHSKSVIYRDLKPTNLGFDIRGDIKLFDFGLAKELPLRGQDDKEMFRLSGAGTLRYMSPEVVLMEPYNLKADVYSFSILLWEVISLKCPYAGYSPRMLIDAVVHDQERPSIDPKWPESIQKLLRLGWSPDALARPSMQTLYEDLRGELKDRSDVFTSEELDHSRRRSTHVIVQSQRKMFNNGM